MRKIKGLSSIILLMSTAFFLSACGTTQDLAPGKYVVSEAKHEINEDDYELQIKDVGEYDIAESELVVTVDASVNGMLLEVTPSKKTLFVQDDAMVSEVVDVDSSAKTKSKKKKK